MAAPAQPAGGGDQHDLLFPPIDDDPPPPAEKDHSGGLANAVTAIIALKARA